MRAVGGSDGTMLSAQNRAEDDFEGFQVKVHGVALVDLLQMFHLSRRSVTLRLAGGMLHVREGEVIHAEYGGHTGEAAVRLMLELRGGELETDSLVPTPVSVQRPLANVLLDALVALDEQGEGLSSTCPDASVAQQEEQAPLSRSSQLDAVCERVNQDVESAVCSVVVDLNQGCVLGSDQRVEQLPMSLRERLLDMALELFSSGSFAAVEGIFADLAPPGVATSSRRTEQVYVLRGEYLYLGKRLNESLVVLVATMASSAAILHMAQLEASLAATQT